MGDRQVKRWSVLPCVFVTSFLLGMLVRWPYLVPHFAWDDREIQNLIGLHETGRLSWFTPLFVPWGEHHMPVWSLLYYAQWRCFGLESIGWHVVVELAHAVTAMNLFLMVAWASHRRSAAWIAALTWACVAFGNWDDVLMWTFCGKYAVGLALLTSSVTVVGTSVAQSSNWAVVASAVMLSLAEFTFSVFILLSVLPPLYMVQTARTEGPLLRKALRRALAIWAVPTSIALLLYSAAVYASGPPAGASINIGFVLIGRVLAELLVAPASASGWHLATGWYLPLLSIPAILILAGLIVAPPNQRAIAAVMLLPMVIYLIAVNAGRSQFTFDQLLRTARYLYFPNFAWCACGGIALSAVAERFNRRSTTRRTVLGMLAGAAALLALALLGRADAIRAQSAFAELWGPSAAQWRQYQTVVRSLARFAEDDGKPMQLPDIPIHVTPIRDAYYPLSSFVAVCEPNSSKQFRFLAIDELTVASGREAQSAILAASNDPVAQYWAHLCQSSTADFLDARWLVEWSRADPVTIPALAFQYNDLRIPVQEVLEYGFRNRPKSVRVAKKWTNQDQQRVTDRLNAVDSPEAARWRRRVSLLTVEQN